MNRQHLVLVELFVMALLVGCGSGKDAEISRLKTENDQLKVKLNESDLKVAILTTEKKDLSAKVDGLTAKVIDLTAQSSANAEAVSRLVNRQKELSEVIVKLEADKESLAKEKAEREALEKAAKKKADAEKLAQEARKKGLSALREWADSKNTETLIAMIRFIVASDRAKIERIGYPILVSKLDDERVDGVAQRALSYDLDPAHPGVGVYGLKYILAAIANKSLGQKAKGFAKVAVINIGEKAVLELLQATDTDNDDVCNWARECLIAIVLAGSGENSVREATEDESNSRIQLSARFVQDRVARVRAVEEQKKSAAVMKAKADAEGLAEEKRAAELAKEAEMKKALADAQKAVETATAQATSAKISAAKAQAVAEAVKADASATYAAKASAQTAIAKAKAEALSAEKSAEKAKAIADELAKRATVPTTVRVVPCCN